LTSSVIDLNLNKNDGTIISIVSSFSINTNDRTNGIELIAYRITNIAFVQKLKKLVFKLLYFLNEDIEKII